MTHLTLIALAAITTGDVMPGHDPGKARATPTISAGGTSPADPHAAHRFVEAVESFVIDATPPSARSLDIPAARTGPRTVSLVRLLGDPRYVVRDLASDALAAAGPDALPALAWGARHRDPEVRRRCEALIDALYQCSTCKGTGYVWSEWTARYCTDHTDLTEDGRPSYEEHTHRERRRCGACRGDGTLRYIQAR